MNVSPHVRRQAKRLLLLSPAGLGIVAAACGYGGSSGTGYGGGSGGNAASPTSAPAASSVTTTTSKLGKILTDAQGRTLYLFTKDSTASSSCTGTCLSVWPAFDSSGAAQAGGGASPTLLGTAPGSAAQVTYNGHPLYYYVGDTKAGDTNGQDLNQFGGSWYVVSPAGAQVGG